MSRFEAVLLSVYVLGLVVFPIIFGWWRRNEKLDMFDDIVPFFFVAALWPIPIVCGLLGGAICLVLVVPVWVFRLLTSLGVKMGNWIENARKKRRSAELAKTAMEQSMPKLDRPWDVKR